MTPYKVQLDQELKPIDHAMRFRFAKWACDRLIEKNLFSDEANSDLGGYVTKKICRIWWTEMKSWRTHNYSLFGADYGPGA